MAKFISSSPSAAFAAEQTYQAGTIARIVGGKGAERSGLLHALRTGKGDTEALAQKLLARFEKIERRYANEWMSSSDEMFGQVLLRRIVREELTVASKRGVIERVFGQREIEFVSAEAVRKSTMEEIFLDAVGREVAHPRELLDNLSLLTGDLKHLVKTGFDRANAYDTEMWIAKAMDDLGEASRYARQSVDAAIWEAKLTGSMMPAARSRAALKDLQKIESSLRDALTELEKSGSPYVTDATLGALREVSGHLHIARSRLDLATRP